MHSTALKWRCKIKSNDRNNTLSYD